MDKAVVINQSKENLVNTYDVHDVIENCEFMTSKTAIEIAERFNIDKRKVYNHSNSGYLLEQRYLVTINKKVDESLKARWDRERFRLNPYAKRY